MITINTRKPYNTQQRDIILSFLSNNEGKCLTVRDIYNGILKNGASIGEATVYRQLQHFITEGVAFKFTDSEGEGAFYRYINDKNECDSHFHLKCVNCAEIIHMKCEFMKYLEQHILADHDFSVDNGRTVIYGLCSNCKKLQTDNKT